MNILFDHPEPAMLAHGGMLTQIQQTKAALEKLGHSVEFYASAPQLSPPPSPCTWEDVARQLAAVYSAVTGQPVRSEQAPV